MTLTTYSRRWLIGAFGAASAAAIPAVVLAEAPATSIRPPRRGEAAMPARPPVADPAALVAAAKLGGAVGYAVIDRATGAVIEARDADISQPPASVAKAITSLYALDRLGEGHRFVTRVIATGPLAGGVVQGDLVLTGSGDPTLSTDGLEALASALAGRGVKGVTGRLLYDARVLPAIDAIDPGQPDHAGYNPALSGLNLNFNRVHFEWRAGGANGYTLTMDARSDRIAPKVAMARMRVVTREVPVFTYAAGEDADNWTVASSALGRSGSRWLPVRHPAVYTAEVFRTLAGTRGIRLPEPEPGRAAGGTELARVQSEPLATVLRDMLRFSTNLTAEVVGLTASGAATLAASGQAMSRWATERFGIRADFRDHSGLGGASRITAADMALALWRAQSTPSGAALRGLMRNIDVSDPDRAAGAGQLIRVQAKTGTLNFVSGLAGYAATPSGRDLVFAIFCADVVRRDRLGRDEREMPPGGRAWLQRARALQRHLLERWTATA